ncbi:hypothetical protein CWB79_04035 [Pseudoalteromonas sp. S1649]|nr:hypothetical protein CWB80_09100 [Pseudoalteromonas sp. S1650]TMP68948.1 hypothetical protein CWB79_04035 [Pseudoalteromonas sp. S1649]
MRLIRHKNSSIYDLLSTCCCILYARTLQLAEISPKQPFQRSSQHLLTKLFKFIIFNNFYESLYNKEYSQGVALCLQN